MEIIFLNYNGIEWNKTGAQNQYCSRIRFQSKLGAVKWKN